MYPMLTGIVDWGLFAIIQDITGILKRVHHKQYVPIRKSVPLVYYLSLILGMLSICTISFVLS